MRKLLALVLISLLAVSLLVGCDSNSGSGGSGFGTEVEVEDDSITTKTEYDSIGRKTVYTYEDGVLKKETHYEKNGDFDFMYVYQYDDNGDLTKKIMYDTLF